MEYKIQVATDSQIKYRLNTVNTYSRRLSEHFGLDDEFEGGVNKRLETG